MCERYSFALPKDKTTRRYGVKVGYPLEAQYNISPGGKASIICDRTPEVLTEAWWGMTSAPGKNGKPNRLCAAVGVDHLLNPDERMAACLGKRCLVPADGFYLWRQVSRRSRVPYRVTLKWNLPFAIAGIWDEEVGASGEAKKAFALLTTACNDLLMPYAGQMPLLLPLDAERSWLLDEEDLVQVGKVAFPAAQMKVFPVSPRLNQKNLNTPALTEPVQAADQFGNYMLFE